MNDLSSAPSERAAAAMLAYLGERSDPNSAAYGYDGDDIRPVGFSGYVNMTARAEAGLKAVGKE
jgi:hypothetical protein